MVANHNDTVTNFIESEELATEALSNGFLVETYHDKLVVYPDNTCVNDYIHSVLFDGDYPSERRVSCDRGDSCDRGTPVTGGTEMISQKASKIISGEPLRCLTRRSPISGNSMKPAWAAGVAIALLLTIACGARTTIFSESM